MILLNKNVLGKLSSFDQILYTYRTKYSTLILEFLSAVC